MQGIVCTAGPHASHIYIYSPSYLQRSIFLLLLAFMDTCTNMISRLGIVIKNERRLIIELYRDGIKIKGDKIGMCCTHI